MNRFQGSYSSHDGENSGGSAYATRDQIRAHLAHIAALFTSGDFDIPMFIHDRVPPGVPVMKARAAAITYTYQETKHGGQVRIKTTDPDALQAVHEFLVFQIQDHRTGDPVTRDLPLPISQETTDH